MSKPTQLPTIINKIGPETNANTYYNIEQSKNPTTSEDAKNSQEIDEIQTNLPKLPTRSIERHKYPIANHKKKYRQPRLITIHMGGGSTMNKSG